MRGKNDSFTRSCSRKACPSTCSATCTPSRYAFISNGAPDNGENNTAQSLLTGLGGKLMLVDLPQQVAPGGKVTLKARFSRSFRLDRRGRVNLLAWHPRIWWGRETHDDFDVKVQPPSGCALATSAPLDPSTLIGAADAEITKPKQPETTPATPRGRGIRCEKKKNKDRKSVV